MVFFAKILRIFTPPPPIAQLPFARVDQEYKKYRRQVFAGIFIGYGAAYLIRKNFSLAMPYLIQQGFSKSQLGLALTALAVAYGFSKFLMGNVSDRSNPKYFLATGLIISTLVTFAFGYATWAYSSIIIMITLMFINGWAQGMCYPPCGRVLAHWYSVKERGVVMASWNIAHNVGGGLIGVLAILGMWIFNTWQSLFYFPAMIVTAFTIVVLTTVRDTPQSVGLPSIEDYHNKEYTTPQTRELEKELTAKEIFFKHIFNNKAIWILAIANIFVYFVRYGVLDWAPTYLAEVKGFDYKGQGLAYFLYEYAGIPSILLCGYISNKFFRNRRTPVIIICMILVTFSVLLYWLNPPGNYLIDNIALIAVGFLIYGPVVLIGMQALDVVYKKAVGTATGLTGFFGYMGGTVCANALMGYIVQHFGWNSGFIMLLIACVLSVCCLIPIWHVGGEDHKVGHH